MYEDSDAVLKRILQLVESCPQSLQEKAFEILLKGYVASLSSATAPPRSSSQQQVDIPTPPQSALPAADESWKEGMPDEVLPRFQTMATRIRVPPETLADIFDFSTDPFTFAAFHVDGKSNRERLHRVAMLVAARSFLATGRWSADWAEIKAMSTHQNCYDVNNFSSSLSAGEGDWFKKVNTGENVQTSAKGQKEAQKLLAGLAGGSDAAKE